MKEQTELLTVRLDPELRVKAKDAVKNKAKNTGMTMKSIWNKLFTKFIKELKK